MSEQTTQRYPLSWPQGWKRTPPHQRQRARFKRSETKYQASSVPGGQGYSYRQTSALTVSSALERRLLPELRRLGVMREHVIVSTNVPTRLDGLPYSNAKEPDDPGVAVYFRMSGKPRVLACDTWDRVADNIAAVAGHIEAIRAIDRYGVGTIEQAFAGYQALPTQASPWWTILEFDQRPSTWAMVEERHRELTKKHHPDRGGRSDTMAKINAARDAAKIDLQVH
jgi:hypothetical protein